MATVAVTCIKNGRTDSFGMPLIAGTYYPAVEINTANSLWSAGYVSVADASVFDQDPLAGTSPLDDFNVARSIAISRQPIETAANLAAELAAIGGGGSGGGGTFTESGTCTYGGGNVTITLPNALSGATLTLTPQTGAVGVDYSGDGGTTWIAVYGGDVDADTVITVGAICTDIRLRPIASGADIDYSVTARGAHLSWTGSITFAGGNEIVDLAQSISGATAYIYPSAGEVGIDYTADDTVNGSSSWTAVIGGDIGMDDSVTFGQVITGVRFRPIAAGAAADYLIRI